MAAAALAGASGAGANAANAQERATLIHGARVFDGTGKPAKLADVLIEDGRIARVGKKLRVPEGTDVIDATGLTLIPGLHDLHPEDVGLAGDRVSLHAELGHPEAMDDISRL